LLTFSWGETLDSVHHQEAGGDPPLAFETALENDGSVGDGRVADMFVEKTAERSQALKPNLKAHISNRQTAGREELLSLLNAPLS